MVSSPTAVSLNAPCPSTTNTSSSARSSRWSPRGVTTVLGSGLSTLAPHGLTSIQLSAYMTQVRLDEINRQLKAGFEANSRFTQHLTPTAWKHSLELERSRLIEEALRSNPELFDSGSCEGSKNSSGNSTSNIPGLPPNCRYAEKIWLPAKEFPEINFVGLLIGPRGNTLRRMEAETGAKLSIRGRGAQKDPSKMDPAMLAAADEDLHAVVMADTQEKFDKAVELVNRIVEMACSAPEQAHELKMTQLRELQMLNGTIKAEEAQQVCTNCGQLGHRRYECRQVAPVANRLLCKVCGGIGHVAMDCVYKNDPQMLLASAARADLIDTQYHAFMNELNNKGTESAEPGNLENMVGGTSANTHTDDLLQSTPWATGLLQSEDDGGGGNEGTAALVDQSL